MLFPIASNYWKYLAFEMYLDGDGGFYATYDGETWAQGYTGQTNNTSTFNAMGIQFYNANGDAVTTVFAKTWYTVNPLRHNAKQASWR